MAETTTILGWDGDIPIVHAERRGHQLVVYCQWCLSNHYHDAIEEGYQDVFCLSTSNPWLETGWILRVGGVLTPHC